MNIQEALLGKEAASRVKHAPELAAALAEYMAGRAAQWARGRAMGYEQAFAFAQKKSRRGRPAFR
jgi:hypothetical protein